MGRLQRQNACTNRRQFGAIRTEPGNLRLLRRRLAEGPEWSETAVSTQEDRASSAAAISAPVNQCGEPWFTRVSEITVWFEVRVLPAPPRSLTQTEISRFIANSPELAGIRRRILSLRNRPGLFNERPSASRRHWESAADHCSHASDASIIEDPHAVVLVGPNDIDRIHAVRPCGHSFIEF
jgi:hypothetical protein